MNSSVQTDEQLGADLGAEAMPVDPVLKSPGARRPVEESTAAADELGGRERLASTADEPVVVPGATARATGSLEVEAGVADTMSESRAEKPVVPEEQTALPEASKGMVGQAVRPSSPLVVTPAVVKEDEVEEIEREESRPQAIRILCKRGDEVVVVEEEDTTRELRKLESALSTVMK